MERRNIIVTVTAMAFIIVLAGAVFFIPFQAKARENPQAAPPAVEAPIDIPVGIFVTSIYDIDFRTESYTVTFWLWATYPTEEMNKVVGGEYIPFNAIEIVNAQSKTISPTDRYVIPNPENGTTYAIAKYTAKVIQHWDVRNFPFDQQNLTLIIESVGIPSSVVHLVPDVKNSLVSEEMKLSGWIINGLQMDSLNYEYRSTFGDPSGQLGEYSRIETKIPIRRIGSRLFINSFLGFFIAFIIISLIYFLDVNSRIGLIMTAIFAAVGNKYTIDTYFPNQSAFGLSDLIQICTFGIIAVGIVATIISMSLVKARKRMRAAKVDRLTQSIVVSVYIIVIAIGTFLAIRG